MTAMVLWIWADVLEFLKYAGVGSLCFVVYFGWKKIGHKVGASYSWSGGVARTEGIGHVTLFNLKDKPLAIFGIHAVDNGYSINLAEYKPPIILKAMEATVLPIDSISERYHGTTIFNWQLPAGKKSEIDIILATTFKNIKCKQFNEKSRLVYAMKKKLKIVIDVIKRTSRGVVYPSKIKYAINYTENSVEKTALVDENGFISSWNFTFNKLTPAQMINRMSIVNTINATGRAGLISPFDVEELK